MEPRQGRRGRFWQENTELYYRALKAIRSAPPPMPVDIRRALGLEIKEEVCLGDLWPL